MLPSNPLPSLPARHFSVGERLGRTIPGRRTRRRPSVGRGRRYLAATMSEKVVISGEHELPSLSKAKGHLNAEGGKPSKGTTIPSP